MKDRQIQAAGAQPSIPIVSPVLHWLSMPVIVYLRSNFGFSFLSPKSVFLAFAWAHVLLSIYAWMEPGTWPRLWAFVVFGLGAIALYCLHLALAFSREVNRQGRHDFHSGNSHLLKLPGLSQLRGNPSSETFVHLWIEPFLVLVAATALRGFFAERLLSLWLLIVAAALWLKEFINYWYGLRSEKKHGDIVEDAEEKMPGGGGFSDVPLPKAAGRKARVKRPPQESAASVDEQRFAELLRIMPPYSREQAEQNYRALMKACHPDPNSGQDGSTARAAELNTAIEFFRESLRD